MIIALLASLVVGAETFLSSVNKYLLGGIFATSLGILFIVSYYFEHTSFLFRGFIWFTENVGFPKKRRMAFVYAAFCIFIGTFIAYLKFKASAL